MGIRCRLRFILSGIIYLKLNKLTNNEKEGKGKFFLRIIIVNFKRWNAKNGIESLGDKEFWWIGCQVVIFAQFFLLWFFARLIEILISSFRFRKQVSWTKILSRLKTWDWTYCEWERKIQNCLKTGEKKRLKSDEWLY